MAKKWNAEDTALILKEVQHPTMTNQELAKQLGRSLQSIAAKKRYAEEQLKKKAPPPDPKRPWTPEEDRALLATPLKSESDLAAELSRTKEDVHKRREQLVKSRLAERKAKEQAEAEKKRVPLEQYTTALKSAAEEAPPAPAAESPDTALRRMQKQLDAARAAMSILKHKNFNTIQEFTVIMDYILGEDESGEAADENPDD